MKKKIFSAIKICPYVTFLDAKRFWAVRWRGWRETSVSSCIFDCCCLLLNWKCYIFLCTEYVSQLYPKIIVLVCTLRISKGASNFDPKNFKILIYFVRFGNRLSQWWTTLVSAKPIRCFLPQSLSHWWLCLDIKVSTGLNLAIKRPNEYYHYMHFMSMQ